MAEHYVFNEHGAFAYTGNTRYGFAGAELVERLFFDTVANTDIHNIGRALQIAKEDFYINHPCRICILPLILLGDPETSISLTSHHRQGAMCSGTMLISSA